jgi:hypothetical protein
MGTNYYWTNTPCVTCGHVTERLHIGKSSGGWCFGLHIYPERENGPMTWTDWLEQFNTGAIIDEYDRPVSVERMVEVVEVREWKIGFSDRGWAQWGYRDEADFHAKNQSERGPNGLLRHRIDRIHCVGHGEGTFDYLIGYFS